MFTRKVRYQPDEFIERVLCTVPGMLHKGNIYLMEKAISEIKSDFPILEIGTFCGQSAIVMSWLLQKHSKNNKIICVDPFIYEGWKDSENPTNQNYLKNVGNNEKLSRVDYTDFVKKSFHFHTSFFLKDNLPELHEMTSDFYFEKNKNQRYSFVFVDGGHSFDQAKRDVENSLSAIESGSYILLDDSEKGSSLGSAKYAESITGKDGLEIADRNPHCLLRKI